MSEHLCTTCRYACPYPDNDYRCIWEKSKANIIPPYVEYEYANNGLPKFTYCENYSSDAERKKKVKTKPVKKPKVKYVFCDKNKIEYVVNTLGLNFKKISFDTGLEYQVLLQWKNGTRAIPKNTLEEIETYLGVEYGYLQRRSFND